MGPPGPPESPGRLHPPASASAGRNPAWYVVRSPPPAANRPEARRPGTVAGSLSPVLVAAGAVPMLGGQRGPGLGQQLGGGLVKAEPAAGGHRVRHGQGYEVALKSPGLLPRLGRFFSGPSRGTGTFPASKRRVRRPAGAGLRERWFAPVVQLPVPMGLGPVLQHPSQSLLGKAALDAEHRALGHIRAWATWGADQPASVLSSIRARVVTRAVLLPARNKCSSWFRCSGVNSFTLPSKSSLTDH